MPANLITKGLATIAKEDIKKFYLSVALRMLGFALIGIFIPIYLYNLGYSIPSIIIYFAISIMVHIALMYLSCRLALRYGVARTNLLAMPFAILSLFFLFLLPTHPAYFILVAILDGIQSAFYWFSFHYFFATLSASSDRAKKYGLVTIIIQAGGLIGPFIGGLILTYSSMQTLLLIAGTFLFLSTFPLFFIHRAPNDEHLDWHNLFDGFSSRQFLAYFGYGFQMFIDTALWAIFFYLIVQQYLTVGFATTIAEIGAILFVYVISYLSDKISRRTLLRINTLCMSTFTFLRSLAVTFWQGFLLNTIFRLSYVAVDIPFSALYYDRAEKNRIAQNILRREYGLHLGTLTSFLFLLILFTTSPHLHTNFIIAFAAAGLLNLLVTRY